MPGTVPPGRLRERSTPMILVLVIVSQQLNTLVLRKTCVHYLYDSPPGHVAVLSPVDGSLFESNVGEPLCENQSTVLFKEPGALRSLSIEATVNMGLTQQNFSLFFEISD